MRKKSFFKLNLKENIVIGAIILCTITVTNWAYLFLPDEYAKEAQIPDTDLVLVVGMAFLFVYVYKIAKRIDKIEKHLDDLQNPNQNKGKTD